MKKILIITALILVSCTQDEAFLIQEPPQVNWTNCQEVQNYYARQIEILEQNRSLVNDSLTTVRINQYQLLQTDCN